MAMKRIYDSKIQGAASRAMNEQHNPRGGPMFSCPRSRWTFFEKVEAHTRASSYLVYESLENFLEEA